MNKKPNNRYFEVFNTLKANQFNIGNTTYRERIKKLDKLKKSLEFSYKMRFQDALYSDFGKPYLETNLTEIYPIIDEINFTRRH